MQNIRFNINTVSRFHNLLFITHCKLKFTTYHISRLRVVMRVRSSYSPFLKFDFNQHYLPIIAHNLSGHTFTCRLPRFFFLYNKSIASCFLNRTIRHSIIGIQTRYRKKNYSNHTYTSFPCFLFHN